MNFFFFLQKTLEKRKATNSALTVFEDKIPNVTNLVKKADYDTKIIEVEKNLLIVIMINILLLQNLII